MLSPTSRRSGSPSSATKRPPAPRSQSRTLPDFARQGTVTVIELSAAGLSAALADRIAYEALHPHRRSPRGARGVLCPSSGRRPRRRRPLAPGPTRRLRARMGSRRLPHCDVGTAARFMLRPWAIGDLYYRVWGDADLDTGQHLRRWRWEYECTHPAPIVIQDSAPSGGSRGGSPTAPRQGRSRGRRARRRPRRSARTRTTGAKDPGLISNGRLAVWPSFTTRISLCRMTAASSAISWSSTSGIRRTAKYTSVSATKRAQTGARLGCRDQLGRRQRRDSRDHHDE